MLRLRPRRDYRSRMRPRSSRPLCPARHPPQSVAACLSIVARRILSRMGTKSRETIYGASVRAAAERATEARKDADRLACEAWNKRMLGFQGPAQPSPALGDAINAGFGYLEVKCLGCNTHQTVALDIVRRPKATPVHELERYMRCRDCSRGSRLSLQAEPSGRAANDQDFRQRSAVDVVAGRAVGADERGRQLRRPYLSSTRAKAAMSSASQISDSR